MLYIFSHYFVRRYFTNYIPASGEPRQVLLVSIFSCVRDKYQRWDLIKIIISLCIESTSVPGHFTSYVQDHACATPKKNGIK